MIHVCPPQVAPNFIRSSPLANEAGWVDVAPDTLRHTRYENIFSLGDVCSAPSAKTLAAARRQAPVVAENLLAVVDGKELAREVFIVEEGSDELADLDGFTLAVNGEARHVTVERSLERHERKAKSGDKAAQAAVVHLLQLSVMTSPLSRAWPR